MQKKYYTVKVDGSLWTNVIDDMNTTESWSTGGIIFLEKTHVKDFVKNLKEFDDWKNSKFDIIELII
jgi:hypothetical protein